MQKYQQSLSLRLDTRPGRRDTAGEIGPRAAFALLHLTSLESSVSHPIAVVSTCHVQGGLRRLTTVRTLAARGTSRSTRPGTDTIPNLQLGSCP